MGTARQMRSLSVVLVVGLLLAVIAVGVVPRGARAAYQVIQLTNNTYEEWCPQIDGTLVVWHRSDGNDYEIFLMDVRTGEVKQLTNNTYHDRYPQVDGGLVVWQGRGPDGIDREIFLYNGTSTIQLTDDSLYQQDPQIDAGLVVWQGASGTGYDIYVYDVATGVETQIVNDGLTAEHPQIDDGLVVWNAWGGTVANEIFLYDVGTGVTTQITNNTYEDGWAQIDDGLVVWNGEEPSANWELYMYDVAAAATVQVTEDTLGCFEAQVDSGQVVYSQWLVDGTSDVFVYDVATGVTTRITDNDYDDWEAQIDAGHMVWKGETGGNGSGVWNLLFSNQLPEQPINAAPGADAAIAVLAPVLSAGAFDDPEGDAHAASRWQVTVTPGDYSSPVWDSGVDPVNLTSVSVPGGVLSQGVTYYWRVSHQDIIGTWSPYSDETSFIPDLTPPVPTVTALAPDPTNDNTPTFTGTATDTYTAIASVEYRVDGGGWTAAIFTPDPGDDRTGSYSFTTAALPEGGHTVEVRVTDEAGNTTTAYAGDSFTVDTGGPAVLVVPLVPDPTNDSTPTLIGTATDTNTAIVLVEYRVDGGGWTAAIFTPDPGDDRMGIYSFTTAAVSDGGHTVEVRATDEAGNTTTAYASDSFRVDTVEPTATGGEATLGEGKGAYVLTGVVTDSVGTIVSVEYCVDGGAWQAAPFELDPQDSSRADYSIEVELEPGDHAVEVRATDDAGNVITADFASFTVAVGGGVNAGVVAGATVGGLAAAAAAAYGAMTWRRRSAQA